MSQKLDHSQVASRLAELRQEEMTGHVSSGFTVARAIREIRRHTPCEVDAAWIEALLPHLSGFRGLMLSSPAILNAVTDDGWHESEDPRASGAVLLFEDGSFLRFDTEGLLDPDELTLSWDGADLDAPFPNHAEAEIIGATPDFLTDHPDLISWAAGLPDDCDQDVLDTIADEICDSIDPPVNSGDLKGEQSWGEDDAARVEAAVKAAWIGMGLDCCAEIEVKSAFEGGGKATLQLESDLPGYGEYGEDSVMERLHEIVDALVDLSGFVGHTWEYNDGAHNRMSGYSQYEETVVYIEIDPEQDFSNHVLLEAQNTLLAKLTAAGMEEAKALALIRPASDPA